ncbi:CHAT domain-containing protein [Amycolatopsis alba]|uniref:CHAT domain-containing protein n=1 Tax=Amycolatopsis alba DSM 44262 TaxID=1125972 RepID=A0A229RKP4_AMYAL|nr:CHAT domain-containing protein [Amycolatopsis alba]OXM47049.1 CHAT domain-containing protein [Amycolatopsis alba DSM 44262]
MLEGIDEDDIAFDELCSAFDDAVSRATDGSVGALTEVVEFGDALIERDDGSGSLDRLHIRYLQGLALLQRFDETRKADPDSDGEDRDRAIDAFREVRNALPPENPAGPEVALRLGMALAHRILQQDKTPPTDLTEAIDSLTAALDAAESFDPAMIRPARQRLGALFTVRFLRAGGDQDDRIRATAELDGLVADPASPQEIVDSAHLGLALLTLSGSAPADLRRGAEGLTSKVLDDLKNAYTLHDQASTDAVLHHLGAISARDNPFGAGVSLLQTLTRMTRNPAESSADDIRLLRDSLVEAQQDTTPDSLESGLLTSIRVTLETQLARLEGTEDWHSTEPMDSLVDILARHGDHPMESLTRDLLGAVATAPDSDSLLRGDVNRTLERLERALRELDDHPARSSALTKLTILAIKQAIDSKSPDSVIRIHGLLTESRERPGTSPRNDAILALLLGWTEAVRSRFDGDTDRTSAAIKLVQEAAERLPEDDELRPLLAPQIYAMLAQRYSMTRDLADLDAIVDLDRPSASAEGTDAPSTRADAAAAWMPRMLKVITALARGDRLSPARITELSAELDAALALVPAEDLASGGWDRLRGILDMLQASHDETGADFPSSGPRLAAFREAVQNFVHREVPVDPLLDWSHESAALLIGEAFASRNRERLDEGIALLTREYAKPSEFTHERLVMLGQLGLAFRMRNLIWRRAQDLDNAITRLEEARLFALREPGMPDAAPIFNQLGECYFARGDTHRRDQARAVAAGLDGLSARMKEVVIQTGASRALGAARHAEGEAAEVARWCVAAADHESAVRALELGRAMVLHSATVDADTPGLLRESGHPELAASWEEQVGRDQAAGLAGPIATARMPSTLRRDVLLAIEGTETEQRLLSPPPVAQIATALRQAGAAAMAYLVPHDDGAAGFAVVVSSDGSTGEIPLPGLSVSDGGPIGEFEDAQRDVQRTRSDEDDGQAKARWTKAAETLSDWAWPAAMGPLLDHLRSRGIRGVPRLVLAPVGRLGGVPWHAARRLVTGGLRYACQDAIISYAASARQFVDASGRGQRDWAKEPALVGVAGTSSLEDHLIWVEAEIAALERFYPGAGVGWPRQAVVRRLLPHKGGPGASLLHLSCHAVRTDPPLDSYLVLAGNTKLYVRDILRQAAQRPPDADGGLVVLAACASDLTETSQDEALTLATAFLAGGAAGAVGTRWPVADLPTALFMIMFHHYLNSGYPAPPTALRAAQLWMLDPDRELPEWVTGLLAGTEKRTDLETLDSWAAFTYQGR